MQASLPSLEDEFIVSVCSAAIMSRTTADDVRVAVRSGGLVLRYESLDELVFVLINLSVGACGEA